MAQFIEKIPPFKPRKPVAIDWDTFRLGVNTLLQDTEIKKQELAQADNLILIGRGIPTKRPGTSKLYQSGNATGSVRGLQGFYPSGASGAVELLAVTDDGFLTKRNGTTFSSIDGVSWASGNNVYMAQLDNRMYFMNGQRELARYSSPTLVGFPTIAIPAITSATNLSGATGTSTKSYRVTAVSNVGETLGSTPLELSGQPDELGGEAGGVIRLTWATVSTASGILQGFNVYGRNGGNERFLAFADAARTTYDDNGASIPAEFTLPPSADSTGGPLARYITRFQDRLIYAGFDNEPTKMLISGRVPLHERFDLASGGNFIKVEPDSGDNITQIIGFRDRIIVFKERSIWQVKLSTIQVGNFFVTQPNLELITASHGCISPRSVVAVGNDIYFLGRQGVFSLGYESGFTFDVLRTNEISVRVRDFFRNLTVGELENSVASFNDQKYRISFPGKSKTLMFDRERLAWMGPQTYDATVYETFFDTDNVEKLLLAQQDSVDVQHLSEDYTDDNGSTIETTLRTRSEDFGDWSLFKNIQNVFTNMRNVSGAVSVRVRIETRTGTVSTTKSFNISPTSGSSGWGADLWGNTIWGDSEEGAGAVEANFTIRWVNLNRIGRTLQITVVTTDQNADYELVGIRADAKAMSRGVNPSSWRV